MSLLSHFQEIQNEKSLPSHFQEIRSLPSTSVTTGFDDAQAAAQTAQAEALIQDGLGEWVGQRCM